MIEVSLRDIQKIQLEALKYFHEFCNKNNLTYYAIAGTVLGSVRHGGFIPWDEDIDVAMMRDDYEKFKSLSNQLDKEKYYFQDFTTDKDYFPAHGRIAIKGTKVFIPETQHLKAFDGCFLDIFPLDKVPGELKFREKQKNELVKITKLCIRKVGYNIQGESILKKLYHKILRIILSVCSFKFLNFKREKIMCRYNHTDANYVCSMASKYSYEKQTFSTSVYGDPSLIDFEDTKIFAPSNIDAYLKQLYGDYMKLPSENKRYRKNRKYYIEY